MSQEIELGSTTEYSLLETLRQQGITNLEELVQRSVQSLNEDVLIGADSPSHGCVFLCFPPGMFVVNDRNYSQQ